MAYDEEEDPRDVALGYMGAAMTLADSATSLSEQGATERETAAILAQVATAKATAAFAAAALDISAAIRSAARRLS